MYIGTSKIGKCIVKRSMHKTFLDAFLQYTYVCISSGKNAENALLSLDSLENFIDSNYISSLKPSDLTTYFTKLTKYIKPFCCILVLLFDLSTFRFKHIQYLVFTVRPRCLNRGRVITFIDILLGYF